MKNCSSAFAWIAMAGAKDLLFSLNQAMLVQYRGHINITKHWTCSLFHPMQRKCSGRHGGYAHSTLLPMPLCYFISISCELTSLYYDNINTCKCIIAASLAQIVPWITFYKAWQVSATEIVHCEQNLIIRYFHGY